MTANKKLLAISTAALCISLGAHAGNRNQHTMNWGSNSLSDEPRSAEAPPMVVSKNAAVEGPMSTVDDRPGKISDEAMRKERMRQSRAEWREDRTVYRSGAPENASASSHRYDQFAYGDDIAALDGLQLELALNQMHHMNQSEIGLAKMAESKAKTPSVLNFAHQLRAEHELMEKKVQALADARDVKLERYELNTFEKVVKNRLNRLSGQDFETAFLRVTDRNHDMAAADLRLMRNDISDERVSMLIDESLPVIEAHKASGHYNGRAMMDEGDLGE